MRRRALLTAAGAVLGAGCTGLAGSSTDTPTPAEFDGFDPDADRVVLETGSGDPPVRLTTDGDTFRVDPDDAVETYPLTLENRSGGEVQVIPKAWRLYRKTSEGWEPQHDPESDSTAVAVGPRESYDWVLATQSHPSPNEPRRTDVIADLDWGRYAFSVTADVNGRAIECIARFDVSRE